MQRRMMTAAALVALGIAGMSGPVGAQDNPCSAHMCLPGYTAQVEPVPGSIFNTMTCRCRPNWTGSSPNIESSDPTRRSTVILSQAGPLVVDGCGTGHEAGFNIRGTGGFFADGQSAMVQVKLFTGLAPTENGFERTDRTDNTRFFLVTSLPSLLIPAITSSGLGIQTMRIVQIIS